MSRILMLSYNFDGVILHDREAYEWKFRRSRYTEADSFLIICWSAKRETILLSERIHIESLPAFGGKRRYLYDLIMPFIIPFMRSCRAFRPDRITIADFPLVWGALSARLFIGGKVELNLGNLPADLARTRSHWHVLYERLHERLGYWIPDKYIAINESTRSYLEALNIPSARITVRVPDTIGPDAAYIRATRKGRVRTKLNIPIAAPLILSIGRLETEKAFDELLKLFATLDSSAHLIVLGEGRLRAQLSDLAHSLGIAPRVHLVGYVSREELWNYYKDADVFVLLSRSEGLGLVLWEAMYMKIPVIGSPVGGIQESIGGDGVRGMLWSSENGVEQFQEKVARSLQRDQAVEAQIERAYAYVTHTIGI